MKKTLLVVLALMLSACTSAGPFVTNIKPRGNNEVEVEKCYIRMNTFGGVIYNYNCSASNVTIK